MRNWALALLLLVLLLAGQQGQAQTPPSSAVQDRNLWMCPCPGMARPLGGAASCNAVCFGSASRMSRPAPPPPGAALAQMAGNAIGQALREALMGNPEQEAAAERERAAAWQRELDRIAADQAAQAAATRERLLGAMKGVDTGPALSLRGADSGGGLQMKLGDAPVLTPSTGTPTGFAGGVGAQLAAANFLTQQAASAPSVEEAATLADAAFNAAVGIPVAAPTPGQPIVLTEAELRGVTTRRSAYFEASAQAQRASAAWAAQVEQLELARRVAAEAAARGTDAANAAALLRRVEQAQASAKSARDAAQRRLEQTGRDTLGAVPRPAPAEYRIPQVSLAFQRGFAEASDCFSQAAGPYCQGLSPAATRACDADYHAGWYAGRPVAVLRLRRAYAEGQAAGRARRPLSVAAMPDAAGVCGVHWVEAFTGGYFGKPFELVDR